MSTTISIIVAILSAIVGGGIGYFVRKNIASTRANSVEALAEKRLVEVKNEEQDILLKAKEKSLMILDEAKKEEEERRRELKSTQERLEKREEAMDQKLTEFEERKTRLQQKVEEIQGIKQKIDAAAEEAEKRLQNISGLSRDQAKEELFAAIEKNSHADLMEKVLKFDQAHEETLKEKAQDILVTAMQRTASSHAAETTASSVSLPSDDMKGRIIGKEGRNIKTIEKISGCELIIDETPDAILVSSFSPIRRRVCVIMLEKLMKDGRIQPAKIEEYYEEAKRELAVDIQKAGEEALHKLAIVGIDPKLAAIAGRLKYRTSYGQNVLQHCLEVGFIAGMLADEIGMDAAKARRAGFFHDIGKSVDHETQGTHTEIGFTILKKFGLDEDTAQVALTHHDTNPPLLITKICMAADAISASRVGARGDTFEQYVARLEDLENTAKGFPGVDKVYAIQAGREIRVFVNPHQLDDYQSYNLAKDIARRIEAELQYPGEIKVMVIRESRVIEYAK